MVALITTLLVVFALATPAQGANALQAAEVATPEYDVTIEAEATRLADPSRDRDFSAVRMDELNALQDHNENGINILWTNRGPGDGFGTIFGAGVAADVARANVDAAINAWEAVITTLNRPNTPGDNTIRINVNMNAGATATSCGGGANGNYDGDGWPTDGTINLNGNAGVWFIDPTPEEHSEFTGNIDNAFSGDAPAASPANGLCDIYTVVVAEILHILGITSDGASRFQTGGFNTQLTNTGNTCSGPGDLWQFSGPSIVALMTSNNGGAGAGGSDFGVPVHTAEPCASNGGLVGANDGGNALFEGSRRYLPSNNTALILADTYNFGLVAPERFATFYSVLNTTTGTLTVRGSDDNTVSDDAISISRNGSGIVASVDIEDDIPGTGPTDAFVTHFDEGNVASINIDGDDGDDLITLDDDLGVPTTVTGGAGNDTIIGSAGPDDLDGEDGNDTIDGRGGADDLSGGADNDNIDGGAGNDTIDGGTGNDELLGGTGNNTILDGTGNDLVDFRDNSVGVTYSTMGGSDTVIGSDHDDDITGGSGTDRIEGRAGADVIDGGPGDDELLGQTGSDTFEWSHGDGDDTIEGGAGEADTVQVTGSGNGDDFVVRRGSGIRLEVNRTNPTPVLLDAADIEAIEIDTAGGPDTLRVANIRRTQVRSIDATLGSGSDSLTVWGTGADEVLQAEPDDAVLEISGLAYDVTLTDSTPSDAVTINGRGGEDVVVVHGSSGADTIQATPTARYAADIAGGTPATVSVKSTEKLIVDGNGGDDALEVQSPLGSDKVKVTPFYEVDAGKVKIARRLEVRFRDLGDLGEVELTNGGGGRADTVIHKGTAGEDHYVADSVAVALNDRIPVKPTGADVLTLNGGGEDDHFEVASTLPYTTTWLRGGSSTDGDIAELEGAAGAVVFDYDSRQVTGYGGQVAIRGIETIDTVQSGGGGTDLTINGSSGDDDIAYKPQSATSGRFVFDEGLKLRFSGTAGDLTIDAGGGADEVAVVGTIGGDTVLVDANSVTTVTVGTWKAAQIPLAAAEIVSIDAGKGEDLIDVTVYDGADANLIVAGDLDAAKRFSDEMIVRNGSVTMVTYHDVKSHVFESGSVFAEYKGSGSETRIDYFDVENLTFFK